MNGDDYIKRTDLHPFWDSASGKEPLKEDVADAFDQGRAEGYWRGIWSAIEFVVLYDDRPTLAAGMARTFGITREMAEALRRGSEYADRQKRMERFFAGERFYGEPIPGLSSGHDVKMAKKRSKSSGEL